MFFHNAERVVGMCAVYVGTQKSVFFHGSEPVIGFCAVYDHRFFRSQCNAGVTVAVDRRSHWYYGVRVPHPISCAKNCIFSTVLACSWGRW